MGLFKKLKKRSSSPVGLWLTSPGVVAPIGYHSLMEAPEVTAAVWKVAGLISSVTLRTYRNTPEGDARVRDELAKKVDISPWSLGTRTTFIDWIVQAMLVNGEAFALPSTYGGLLQDISPMPGAAAQLKPDGKPYEVVWNGIAFDQNEVLHYRLHADLRQPWKGASPQLVLQQVVDSIMQTAATKQAYMSSEYKPPIIVAVNSDSDLSNPDEREKFVKRYMKRNNPDEPMIIPADLMNVVQAKPLSLTDLAIKDGIELDKKTVASILDIPAFVLGVGSFNKDEYDNWIRSRLVPICKIIEQENTKKLLISPERYFKFSTLRLYSYGIDMLANIGRENYKAGLMTGNEVRDWQELPPLEGLNELVMLENYIPSEKIGEQKKLIQEGESNGN